MTGNRDVFNNEDNNMEFLNARWTIEGMLYDDVYINKSDTEIINSMEVPAMAVGEVLGPNDGCIPDDVYVDTFFERTGTGWNLRNVPNGFDEYGFCSICRERNNCPRVENLHMWRMQQMFVDMSMEEDQLENRQKRFLLYKVQQKMCNTHYYHHLPCYKNSWGKRQFYFLLLSRTILVSYFGCTLFSKIL